jgi:hypothetical protein
LNLDYFLEGILKNDLLLCRVITTLRSTLTCIDSATSQEKCADF